MDPRGMSIDAGEIVQLCLLAVPEDAKRQEAHEVRNQLGRHPGQHAPEVFLAMDSFSDRSVKIEDEQRHRHGENPVTQCGESLDVVTGAAVFGPSYAP